MTTGRIVWPVFCRNADRSDSLARIRGSDLSARAGFSFGGAYVSRDAVRVNVVLSSEGERLKTGTVGIG